MTAEVPQVCRGLAVVPVAGGLLVEGGPRRRLFRGAAATEILPRLLPLLDGRHDRRALRTGLGLSDVQLNQVFGLLAECGLLDAEAEPRDGGEHARHYYSRTLSTAGGYRGSADLLTSLRRASVVLMGGFLEELAEDLLESGVGTVELIDGPDRMSAAHRSLAVVHDDGAPDTLEHAGRACRASGAPLLRIAAGDGHVDIGPIVAPPQTACATCVREGLAEAGWDADPGAAPPTRELMCGLAAGEILAHVGHVHQPTSRRRLTRVALDGLATEYRLVTPDPDCPECGFGRPYGAGPAPRSEQYEWWMRQRIGEPRWRGERPPAEARRIRDLQTVRPAFPTSPRHALPVLDFPAAVRGAFGAPRPSGPGAADLATLTGILIGIAGRRPEDGPDENRRWAPSGGNLASVAAYLITERGPGGLPGTRFRYDDIGHQLISIRSDALPLREALAGTDLDPDGLDAVIVLVADIDRLAGKYEGAAFRMAHLDAGCAAMQLSAVATGYGLDVVFATSWDERVGALLELSPHAETVTVIAGLRGHDRENRHAAGR